MPLYLSSFIVSCWRLVKKYPVVIRMRKVFSELTRAGIIIIKTWYNRVKMRACKERENEEREKI